MKKNLLLLILLSLLSCGTSDINDEQPKFKYAAKESNLKSTADDLLTIQDSILKAYTQNPVNDKTNLNEIIIRLDSITSANSEFQKLKIANYSLPTSTEIESLIDNYTFLYSNLNISVECKSILDLFVNNQIESNELSKMVTAENISPFETKLLFYVSYNLKGSEDNEWKKNKTVFIIDGYTKQPACGVFQACLFEILYN